MGVIAAWLSLATLLLFGVLALGVRVWLHWRRTGSTGLRGLSGGFGSAEWFGGVLVVVGVLLAALSPVLVLGGVTSPWSLPVVATALGGALLVVGVGGTIAAQSSMGESWRVGVDPTERTVLVERGLFRISRNPIFASMLLVLAGLALVLPTFVAIAAFASALVGLELQVRMVEEPYLTKTHGDAYLNYAARVGRFLPFIGRMHAKRS